MGNEPLKLEDVTRTFAQANNLAGGRHADGTMVTGPFMENSEYVMMGGMGLFTVGTQRKQLLAKPTWNGQTVSRLQYGQNMFKTNFSSLSNFNNMEFIDTRVQQLEGIINGKTPKLPEGFRFNNPQVERLYNNLLNAKNPREFSEIIRRADAFNQQFRGGRANTSVYRQLCRELVKHPEELAKLKNLPKYRQIYGKTLNEFQAAQRTMRSGSSLPKGRLAELHKMHADARLAENKMIRAKGTKVGAGRMARVGANMSSGVKNAMAASKTMRTMSRYAGRAGGALMVVMSAANAGMETYGAYAMAKEMHPEKAGKIALKQAGKSVAKAGIELGGAWAGMKAGALIGSCCGPVGAVVGGLVGSFVGWAAGSWVAKKTPVINKSEMEIMQEEERVQQQTIVQEAVENNRIDILAENMAQFYEMEEVKDEQGNISVQLKSDANGEPIIRKVSDNKDEQFEFEQKVKSLSNLVETEATKLQHAQELQQQLPAEMTDTEKRYYAQQNGGVLPTERPSFDKDAYLAQFQTGFDKGGYASSSSSYGSTSWTNPAWQDSLGQRFDSTNYFSFDPSNYSPYMMYQPQYYKAS